MILHEETAKRTAEKLLQIQAIKLQPKNPFTWASGWKSPIYCDNRLSLSYPDIRNFLAKSMSAIIRERYAEVEVIAGVATGAIAIGVLVAEELNLPFVYVRPKPKEHGRQNQVEGQLDKGKKVVVIEDLISTGKSSLEATEALRAEGAEVLGMVAIFTYEFEEALKNFERADCQLYTLSSYRFLLEQALEIAYIRSEEYDTLQEWRKKPSVWQPAL